MFQFKWTMEIFLESIFFNLITISMNLFDQLVIVICDPVMEDRTPSGKGYSVLIIVCSI